MNKKWETIKVGDEYKPVHLVCGKVLQNGFELADHACEHNVENTTNTHDSTRETA